MGTIRDELLNIADRFYALQDERNELKDHCEKLKTACLAKDNKIYEMGHKISNLRARAETLETTITEQSRQLELADEIINASDPVEAPKAPNDVAAFLASERGQAFLIDLSRLRGLYEREGKSGDQIHCKIVLNRCYGEINKNA